MKSKMAGSDGKAIRSEGPLSEKDEVKQAERNTASAQKRAGSGSGSADVRRRRPLL